jgi:dTDP-6-deoxy-L-talose 4-dehydrogenase (NAD+)
MKRVLLTGATGFVGRQILRALVASGAKVTATLRPGQQVPDGTTALVTPDLFAEGRDFWQRSCQGQDAVVHSAWYAEPGAYLHSPKNLHCLAGTLRLAEGAMAAGVGHFQGIGSCFEYDLASPSVSRREPLSPLSPLNPATPYGAAKAAAFIALSRQNGPMQFAWSRLFYLFGEGEDPRRLVPYVESQIAKGEPVELSSGRQIRDFLDVAEAGRQIAAVTAQGLAGPLNICSGQAVTVAALAQAIADRHGRPDLIRLGARPERADDPPFVVGVPSMKATQ